MPFTLFFSDFIKDTASVLNSVSQQIVTISYLTSIILVEKGLWEPRLIRPHPYRLRNETAHCSSHVLSPEYYNG